MFKKVLIANRGEIAARIARTCKRLGVATVGIHSEADEGALHTQAVDVSVLVGPAAVKDSYLNIEKILAIAKEQGADAVHPGYGLLSEKKHFAQAVIDAGLTWIGPPVSALELLGDKLRSSETALKVGVPLVPGSPGPVETLEEARAVAAMYGYPLLVKPVGGGGGIGMTIAKDEAALEKALESAKNRGASAFGDARVFVQRYVLAPRHIEVQLFADAHGTVVALGERECSVQRRHQKIIEESPAPAFLNREDGAAKRKEILDCAVRLAREAGYVGAGTAEFIWEDARGEYYFLEVNCRLQVEHPVTEAVTGLDLVEWQLRVACGEKLPESWATLEPKGHAIECRIYAEDPAKGFIPKPGAVDELRWPEGEGIRVDAGVLAGGRVTPYYDPMIAKMITHAKDRPSAIALCKEALANTHLAPIVTNTSFLRELVASDEFARGVCDTGFAEIFAKRAKAG
ncbi:MAG: biotin carboxylase N-terminal domain-containing protein [Deltaproteobacteria bacterium]|nr:biotin carboxylase N-terminal domain-containing protein [Deltaproteobacteria bacterium]